MKTANKFRSLWLFLWGTALFLCPQVNAQNAPEHLIDDDWLRLLHFRTGIWQETPDVITSEFYLTSNPRPDSELRALIDTISKSETQELQSLACKFPARIHWLTEKSSAIQDIMKDTECDSLNQWKDSIQSISLIFASGYLGNPASYYGHLLLKFNAKAKRNHLLDKTMDFGAILNGENNPILYILKGLFGGYPGGFSSKEFYHRSETYGSEELRDLWEYPLQLRANELQRLLEHSWELRRSQFTYYFMDKNCAFRVQELISVALGKEFSEVPTPWSIPAEVIHVLSQNSDTLLQSVPIFHPSAQTIFRQHYELTPDSVQELFQESLTSPNDSLKPLLAQLFETSSKVQLLDLLLYYHKYKFATDHDSSIYQQAKNNITQQRLLLPPSSSTTNLSKYEPLSKPQIIRLFWGYNNMEHRVGLEIMPAYYNALSQPNSQPLFSTMEMLNLKFFWTPNRLILNHWWLVNIENLSLTKTGLSSDGDFAWGLRTGLYNQKKEYNQVALLLNGSWGKAWLPFNNVAPYLLSDLILQAPQWDSDYIKGSLRCGVYIAFQKWLGIQIQGQFQVPARTKIKPQYEVLAGLRISLSKDWDIRLYYTQNLQQKSQNLELGSSFYY